MKKRSKYIISLSVLSVLFGVLVSFQTGQDVEDYKLVSLSSIQMMKDEIAGSTDEIENLNKLIDEKNMKLNLMKKAIEEDDDSLEKYINEETESIKLVAGLKDVKGPGIKLIIGDNEERQLIGDNIQDDIIHDSEVQIIINDLKNAGAEAISINGERLTYKSEVKCGGPIIRINGKSSANPFVINVIGDPELLYSSVTAKKSFGWTLKEVYNKKVEVEIKDEIFIPKYDWLDSSFKYANPIKEGD